MAALNTLKKNKTQENKRNWRYIEHNGTETKIHRTGSDETVLYLSHIFTQFYGIWLGTLATWITSSLILAGYRNALARARSNRAHRCKTENFHLCIHTSPHTAMKIQTKSKNKQKNNTKMTQVDQLKWLKICLTV